MEINFKFLICIFKGPLEFLNLKFGIEVSEKWFIEMWNYTIIPFLNDIVKMKYIVS